MENGMKSVPAELRLCRAASFTHSKMLAISPPVYCLPRCRQASKNSSRAVLSNLLKPAGPTWRESCRSASSTEFISCRSSEFASWRNHDVSVVAAVSFAWASTLQATRLPLQQFRLEIDLRPGESD